MHVKTLQALPSTARERQRLLARIKQQFQTLVDTARVGSLQLSFTRIADPNRVLDEVAAREDRREKTTGDRRGGDELHLPYWAELWDSSLGVGQFLLQIVGNAADRPVRVMDLGCGMGFTGMVAAAAGADVLLADLEPAALLFARVNALQYSTRVRARRTNWQKDRLGETFDLIVGADILYEKTQWEFQEPFWRAHLAREGTVLLGEPGRQTGDLFLHWIKSRAWQVERFEEPVITRSRPIRLLRLRPV